MGNVFTLSLVASNTSYRRFFLLERGLAFGLDFLVAVFLFVERCALPFFARLAEVDFGARAWEPGFVVETAKSASANAKVSIL